MSTRGARARARAARLAALAAAVGTFCACSAWSVALANHRAPSWRQAHHVGLLGVLLSLVAAMVVFALVAWLMQARSLAVRAAAGPLGPAEAESVALAPGERGAWTGRAHMTWWLQLFLVVLGAVFLAVLHSALAAIPAAAMLAICVVFGWIRVSVDWRGLRVRYGPLPWPVTTIPLARVRSAERIDLRPLDWGGWGYRGSRVLGRGAIVVRGGDAIRLQLGGGGEFAVTVDDAAAGAGLLNDLVRRAREELR